jgi:hypothetical protein
MSRARPRIPQRKRIFIGCEGASEASYCRLIDRLANEQAGLHVHIVPHILQPGAGDPLQLVRKAVAKIAHEERRHAPFAVKAILLDRTGSAEILSLARALANDAAVHLVWQEPDHEAFLLRHLPNCSRRRPAAGATMAALQSEWPDYDKGIPMLELARKIGLADLLVAASVEDDLRELLLRIGFGLN